ncbi:MAG TPA: hypothetical protein PLV42_06260 [bacterium]|nr:hypothetical protein [bacterium]
MRKILFLFILCFMAVAVAQEEAAPVPAPAEEKAAPATGDAVEARIKAIEENQAKLEEENKKLREELAAKKEVAEAPKAESAKEEKKEEKKAVEFAPYGFIELYGWAHDAAFNAGDFPIKVVDEGKSTTGMTAKNSRFGTKIMFPRIEEVKLGATLEIDFFTNMADTGYAESYPMIRMRHAFFELSKTWDNSTLGFKAGQTWSTATPILFPAQINPSLGWGLGNLWQRMPLVEIYFTQKFAETFAFTTQLAAVRAMSGASANKNGFLEVNIDAGDASHIPQIQGQLSLKGAFAGLDLLVAVGGAWGRESYKGGVIPNKDTKKKLIGDTADVVLVNPALKLSHEYFEVAGKFFWGQNVDVFGAFGGALITELVAAETPTTPKTSRVTGSQTTLGYWAQATGKPLKGWNLNVGYGAEDPEKEAGADLTFLSNSSVWVSSFYTFFERVTIGVQWSHVWTELLTKDISGNTIMGSAKVSF